MSKSEIVNMTATEMVGLIKAKNISATEVMDAHLMQINSVNPKVNAIVTIHPELGIEGAKLADKAIAKGEHLGLLHGLPTAHKDLVPTKGIRTTYGSPLYAAYIPDYSALIVERMQKAGAITIGKTNTPEYGWKGATDNLIFGPTFNPWNLELTPGGSRSGTSSDVSRTWY